MTESAEARRLAREHAATLRRFRVPFTELQVSRLLMNYESGPLAWCVHRGMASVCIRQFLRHPVRSLWHLYHPFEDFPTRAA